MAIIKIQRSQSKIANVPTPNVSALRLDSNLAIAQGNAISSIGKIIEDTKAKTKKTEDKNELQRLITETLPEINKRSQAYNKSTNIDDANSYLASMDIKEFEPFLQNSNKEVKELFKNYLFKETVSGYKHVHTGILSNHIKETKLQHNNNWNELTKLMAANDTGTAANAEMEF